MAQTTSELEQIIQRYRGQLEKMGIAAARILEPAQAQGFTPTEISRGRLTPFWEQIIKEQAIAV